MCGRYTSTTGIDELRPVFAVDEVRAEAQPPRYNVAPTMPVYAVALTGGRPGADGTPTPRRRALGTFRWGLVPSWSADPASGARMINARAEGITTRPAFRDALARRRCLIPADAFYEWQPRPGRDGRPAGKLPHAVRRRDGRPMALAGIWAVWRGPGVGDGDPLRTCAVVTTGANALMAPIHSRMPVVLEEPDWAAWLDPATPSGHVEGLMRPASEGILEAYPVSSLVNKVTNDGPELLDRLAEPPHSEAELFPGLDD